MDCKSRWCDNAKVPAYYDIVCLPHNSYLDSILSVGPVRLRQGADSGALDPNLPVWSVDQWILPTLPEPRMAGHSYCN